MADVGYISLFLALAASIYSTVAFVAGARSGSERLTESARNGLLVTFGLVTISAGALLVSLVTHDFRIEYVANYTSRDMALPYLISALWAGNSGSLLTWAWLLTICATVFVLVERRRGSELVPYAAAVTMFATAFFLLLLLATANPFETLGFAPADGTGLNPLLENPGMLVHPITLLGGYVGLTVPFALAVAALVTRRLGGEWVIAARRWTLIAWLFLGVGNLIGAWWAYVELGWGGYWAWDPVENASLMPWLVTTALLHSFSMQKRRGIFKAWNVTLAVLAFVLTIFGTFLTRSNLLSSVHAFPETGMGPYFIAFMALAVALPFGLMYSRRELLSSEGEAESFVSREGTFLFNNLLLVGSSLVILLGTLFPWLSRVFGGREVEVGSSFFNQVNAPLFLLIVLLAGICTTIGWRRATRRNLVRNLLVPILAALAITFVTVVVGVRELGAIVAVFTACFVVGTVAYEWARGTMGRVRGQKENVIQAFANLISSNRPRYGGYIVHIGIAVLAIGIAGSSLYEVERETTLKPGESMTLGGYTVTYDGLERYETARRLGVEASLSVDDSGRPAGRLVSQKFYDPRRSGETDAERQWVTEVGIRSTFLEDLYVILIGWDEDGTASFQVLVNPLVMWLWIGGGILVVGGLIAFWPERVRETAKIARQTETGRGQR
jgi:cytochrome c-type biogenesis protein CcmF